jgi:hypothetical protein
MGKGKVAPAPVIVIGSAFVSAPIKNKDAATRSKIFFIVFPLKYI